MSFVRLRTINGRHTFTLKRPAENVLSCVEHETEVTDREAMHAAILAMGFRATVRIRKVRRTGVARAMVVGVDEVDGLGGFLELERMMPDGTPGELVQAEMVAFVDELGVDAARCEETYDALVRATQLAAVS